VIEFARVLILQSTKPCDNKRRVFPSSSMSRKRPRVELNGIPELSFSVDDSPALRVANVSKDRRRVNERRTPFIPLPPSPVKSTTGAQVSNFSMIYSNFSSDTQEDNLEDYMEDDSELVLRGGLAVSLSLFNVEAECKLTHSVG
jgi:hypothetical protein